MACNESQPSKSVEVDATEAEPTWSPLTGIALAGVDPALYDERDRIALAAYETNGVAIRARVVSDVPGTFRVEVVH